MYDDALHREVNVKILLLCVKTQVVIGFRKTLIESMQKLGHDVAVITFDREHEELIKSRGIEFHCLEDSNRSLNPFKILSLKKRYAKKIREIAPDIVFTFMLKPNTFGVLGAKKAGVEEIYSMVEGAGDVFIYNSLKWRVIRKFVCYMFRKSLCYAKKVFFLNTDDRDEFISYRLVKKEQCDIVPGIGVDLDRFAKKPLVQKDCFLMVSRMLKTKGVLEYCEAAKKVKSSYPNAKFRYLGGEGTVKLSDIQSYIDEGIIDYKGTTLDVVPYYEEATVAVLPSYREGLGLVNAEASAVGRPVITCDTIGTRCTVVDGYNGFLVPVGDSNALAEKMIYFLEHPDEIVTMGENGRRFAEEHFDKDKINQKICSVLRFEREKETV